MVRFLGVAALLLLCGCLPVDVFQHDNDTALVSASPFTTPAPVSPPNKSFKVPVSSPEAAIRVDRVGQLLLAGHKQLGIKPDFMTIGMGDPEIFHQGITTIWITESLVRLCKTEGQLAAVLSLEIGKMLSEQESLLSPEQRDPPRPLPMTVQIGNAGQGCANDELYLAEVAKVKADRRLPAKRFTPSAPEEVARKYLEAAGFDAAELTAVAPLLQAAQKNYVFEKQLKGPDNSSLVAPQ
jgi:hypothetical protein